MILIAQLGDTLTLIASVTEFLGLKACGEATPVFATW
jgi:hypothetical protein